MEEEKNPSRGGIRFPEDLLLDQMLPLAELQAISSTKEFHDYFSQITAKRKVFIRSKKFGESKHVEVMIPYSEEEMGDSKPDKVKYNTAEYEFLPSNEVKYYQRAWGEGWTGMGELIKDYVPFSKMVFLKDPGNKGESN